MIALFKSEWRKLVYVRANWGLLVASTFISVLSVVVTPFILTSGDAGQLFGLGLDQTAAIDATYANGISGYIFAIILGIMLMAGEFRHGTAVATFLTAPKRGVVLSAKLAIAALGGTLLMIISTGLSLAAGYFVLLGFEEAADPSENLFLNTMLAAALSGAVLGVIGVAIGTLIRNQMLAIVGALVYLFVVDPLLLALWPDTGKFLPSGLITAMLSIDISAPELGFDTTNYLPALTATLVLLGYGAVFAFVAIATSLRRDID
jgi:ABC-type transport system involved in multi-copper enzyme maturation permease subunit